MHQVTSRAKRWTETGELDCQPEDATSAAGVTFCRLRVVQFHQGEAATRTVLYTSGRLAERCRDGLGEGDVIQAIGLIPTDQRSTARHPEVLIPDTPGAVKLRRRAEHIADAARGCGRAPSRQPLIVHCLEHEYDVYIGRGRDPKTGRPGRWGNRYSSRPSKIPGVIRVRTPEEAIELFKRDLWNAIKGGTVSLEALAALDGKILGCWHEDPADAWRSEFTEGPRGDREPCHGHVLIDAAAWAKQQLRSRAEVAA